MSPDPSQTPEDRPPHHPRPEPDVTSQRLADRWDAATVRHVLTGAVFGLLALPALASALVGLLVLAVQGSALWLLVIAAALVTAALAAGGAVVALRRGHRGVVHRLAVLAGVWGVVTTLGAVVLALASDAPDRVGVAVLLVLGGTYTLVVAAALAGGWRVLPAPPDVPVEEHRDGHGDADGYGEVDDADVDPQPASQARTGATPTVSEVPTPAVAPDDDSLADWPAWGGAPGTRPDDVRGGDVRGGDVHGGAVTGADAADAVVAEERDAADAVDATRVDLPRADVVEGPYVGPPYVRPPYAAPADGGADDDAAGDDATGRTATGGRPSATRPPAPRSTSTSRTSTPRTSSGAASTGSSAPRTSSRPATPRSSSSTARTSGATSRAAGGTSRTSGTTPRAGGPKPPRRSVTSGGPRVTRATSAEPATERIARADGEDGPPTERLPPLEL